jgi:hypothetical protein
MIFIQIVRFGVGERPSPSAAAKAPVTGEAWSGANHRQETGISDGRATRPNAIRAATASIFPVCRRDILAGGSTPRLEQKPDSIKQNAGQPGG